MPANNYPIYSKSPDIQWVGAIVTANNTKDITSGTSYLVFTADANNGGFLEQIKIKADPANNTAATVFRFFINNGSTTGTASNSTYIGELPVPATTASAAQATQDFSFACNFALPPGYKVYLTIGTAPGGSGQFSATAIGGKY